MSVPTGTHPNSAATQFKPGAEWKGNAGGATKEVRAQQRAARELALEYCPRAIQELVMLLDSEDPRVRIVAANSILDRGLGKPAQAIVGDADNPIEMIQKVERSIVRPNPKD